MARYHLHCMTYKRLFAEEKYLFNNCEARSNILENSGTINSTEDRSTF